MLNRFIFHADLCERGQHNCDKNSICVPVGTNAFQCRCQVDYKKDGNNCVRGKEHLKNRTIIVSKMGLVIRR